MYLKILIRYNTNTIVIINLMHAFHTEKRIYKNSHIVLYVNYITEKSFKFDVYLAQMYGQNTVHF